jgi:DNA repair exonuclease SbcCD ATPase subunit
MIMRISAQQRQQNETRIRAAMDRLLRGDIPPGGRCDVKTLAHIAVIDRTAFYGSRPYAHLREEFETRVEQLREAGETPDPRDTQITTLKNEIQALKRRVGARDQTIEELTDFKTQALARLAAQHDEITRLRATLDQTHTVRELRPRHRVTGPCS